MKAYRWISLVLAIVLLASLVIACGEDEEATPTPTPDYSSITGELSQLIQGAMEGAGITGLSVALVDDQEMVWAEGFGYVDKENGVEAAPETVYQVASISKLFTATAIMQLVEEGELNIDQPLQTYVPEFSINSRFPEAGPITPRDVMTHHSGLPSDWLNGMFAFGDDREALVASEFDGLVSEIKDAYVTNPPNTAFSYSNLGYALLGHAVEQVTGQGFSDYVDEAILQPMGMDSSSFTLTSDMKALLSKEYLNGEEQEYIWGRDIPAGSLRSTVEDLSRFIMMVFDDGEVGGERILQPQSLAEMLSPQNSDVPLDFDARWGLSWWLLPLGLDYAGEVAWHSGGEGMWNSLLVTLPDQKLGVVVLSNSGEAGGAIIYQIATTILEQALEVKAGIGRPSADPPDVVSPSTDELLSYVGSYTTDLGWMNIRVDGANLYADVMGQSFKLLPHGEGLFSIEGISWSDAQVAIKVVNGRTALNLYGFAVGGLGFGERLEPATIPEAWMDRVGFYEITNGKPGFLTFLSDVQLKYENEFLLLDVTRSDMGEQFVLPIGPLSDDEAVILGLGQRLRGETISVVEVDGEEHLFYSGYLMRKLGTTELLQRALEAAVDSSDTNYPGAVLHVSSPELGTWTGAAGLGEIATDTATRPDDRFRAGSLTKPFISVIILQLVEEGLLSLDDTLPEVLPESVTGKFPNTDQMTVRMLLNHTAGLPDFMDLAGPELIGVALGGPGVEPNPGKVWTEEEFLDFAAAQEPLFAPGEAQGYSNTDYLLLGMVIEQATGRTWREEFRERMIEELDLENTVLPEIDDRTIPGDYAHGYADFGGGVMDATELVTASVVGAAGGQSLVTTPEDLARFMDAALAGELFQEDETLDEMLTWVDWPDGNPLSPYLVSYGLGLMKADFGTGIEGIGHSGDTEGGYHVFAFHLPDQDMTISGAVNSYDYKAGFLLIPSALEILVPGYTAPEPEVASTPPITDADGNVIPGSIAAIETVTLGGVEQTVTIRGADTTKPVLLFLHGGPGMPSSPWATWNNVHADLEADFVFVHWDQRGAGKSYSEDLTADDMHIEDFVSDTLELTDILRDSFNQDKIFLWGHSWGSGLGFETLRVNSEPYHAYIASAARPDWNSTQEMGYEKVLEMARQANDTEAIQALESIQPFDPTNPDHVGIRGQFLSQYLVGDFHTEGLEEAWLNYVLGDMSPEYPSAYLEQTLEGQGFSRQTIGLEVVTSGYDHATDFPVSTIPVHFIQGRYDYECPGELAEVYYNSLEAPVKSFTWFENSAHDVYYDEPDEFNQEMIRIANETLNP